MDRCHHGRAFGILGSRGRLIHRVTLYAIKRAILSKTAQKPTQVHSWGLLPGKCSFQEGIHWRVIMVKNKNSCFRTQLSHELAEEGHFPPIFPA